MTTKCCSVSECDRPFYARDLCKKHWQRKYTYKVPLILPRDSLTIEDRFWRQVNKSGAISTHAPHLGECWVWTGTCHGKGYGHFKVKSKTLKSHHFAWALEYGDVPSGHILDHLCRVTACVRTTHLEPVTHGENTRRGKGPGGVLWSPKTHCINGHEFTPENTAHYASQGNGNTRICRQCTRERRARYRSR